MKAIFTAAALAELNDIITYTLEHHPRSAASLDRCIGSTISHIEMWPESARLAAGHPGVRVVPLLRYPFKLFYRIHDNEIEILHIHHAARDSWAE
jgi:toxin ParE1/3/4